MPSFKLTRLTEDFKREICTVIRDLKDPRITSNLVSVVKVSLTNDLSFAKVYVSSVAGREQTKQAVEGLKSAEGFIKHALSGKLEMRRMPKITFVADDSIEKSSEINNIILGFSKDVRDED